MTARERKSRRQSVFLAISTNRPCKYLREKTPLFRNFILPCFPSERKNPAKGVSYSDFIAIFAIYLLGFVHFLVYNTKRIVEILLEKNLSNKKLIRNLQSFN